jgi:hypothetical protein
MACRIDHITITSPSLNEGSELVYENLGVRPQQGGEHPRMGTHNLLLRLGESMFLEVIAINHAAAKPSRARWFELDTLPPKATPRLACWVARTESIHEATCAATEALGRPEPMSRGSLEWLISIPEDGSLPLGGAAPVLIEWHTAAHPAAAMQDLGCSLVALELQHPEPLRVSELLHNLRFSEPSVNVTVHESATPGLVAHIRIPEGLRTIGTPASSI